jgi:hypothetical protein
MNYRHANRITRWGFASVFLLAVVIVAEGPASADARYGAGSASVCSLTSAGIGQPGSVTCLDVVTGAVSQSVAVGATVAAAGGIAGSLVRRADRLLVTNQAQGAVLFEVAGGQLRNPVTLSTGGEGSLSGALSGRGAYVLTGTHLFFFPKGATTAASSQPLLKADGSAAQVTLAGGYAYVSEKSGSLEAFSVGRDGNLTGPAMAVSGVPAGAIVGITAADDLVIAPIAHLASNANQSTIPVVRGLEVVQIVPTKEMAACWAANDDGEACVTNPGSMTVSCGRLGHDGFKSYTSAAASLVGETVFDVDMADELVGILGRQSGAPVLLTFTRSKRDGDFLMAAGQFPLGTAAASGAVILPGR